MVAVNLKCLSLEKEGIHAKVKSFKSNLMRSPDETHLGQRPNLRFVMSTERSWKMYELVSDV